MTDRGNGARMISVTMRQPLFDMLQERCAKLEQPVSLWVRDAIKQRFEREPLPPFGDN